MTALPQLWSIKHAKQGPWTLRFGMEKLKLSKTRGVALMQLSKRDLLALRDVIEAATSQPE